MIVSIVLVIGSVVLAILLAINPQFDRIDWWN